MVHPVLLPYLTINLYFFSSIHLLAIYSILIYALKPAMINSLLWCRFIRGDQYAIALALLDEGKVVLGVLACPNLPLTSISGENQQSSQDKVGCLFFATVGTGTYMQPLDGSSLLKVSTCIGSSLHSFSEKV